MKAVIQTQLTQHTLWQALSGETPPLPLYPLPIGQAAFDSREIGPTDLFVALAGKQTDGHNFIANALQSGARAIICEAQGREQLAEQGAILVDCTAANPVLTLPPALSTLPATSTSTNPIAYIVKDSISALQRLGGFQRLQRTAPQLRVIGVTGSVGKTSTKELGASVLSQRYKTLYNRGNLNNELGLPLTLLGLGLAHERAILEMGMYDLGEIRDLCTLARPQVGVITNVGPSHLSRLGTIERIAQAKAELVDALPTADDGGVVILNWDDERVKAMADRTKARLFRYGLTAEADLWADEIESEGMKGIRFRFHYREPSTGKEESLYVRVPLLGRHSVHTALRAGALGLVEGMSWAEIVTGMQRMSSQLRLVVVPGIHGSRLIDDTYNASPASSVAALNLLADLQPANSGRRIAVLGDMLELGQYTSEGHKLVGRRGAVVADMMITVGGLGKAIGEEARFAGMNQEQLHIMDNAEDAINLLNEQLRPDDLVLVKGSRAVGMDKIVTKISLAASSQFPGGAKS